MVPTWQVQVQKQECRQVQRLELIQEWKLEQRLEPRQEHVQG